MTEVVAPVTEDSLQGTIERVTFHNENNGFCVLRVKTKKSRDVITVVGHAASVNAGEMIEAEGEWQHDKQHGLQFKASRLEVVLPSSKEGIEKYLASGMIKGIGPQYAKRLVQAFDIDVFDVIEQTPEKLLQVEGIGHKRQEKILAAWVEQKAIRHIMIFLQSHGVGTSRAVRIYKSYGDNAITIVQENPYRLALDIYGIGFKTADQLAQRLGISKHAMMRAQAGIRHVLQTLCQQGHCGMLYPELILQAEKLLEIPDDILQQAVAREVSEEHLILDTIQGAPSVFLANLYHAEKTIAEKLMHLTQGDVPWGDLMISQAIAWVEKKNNIDLSPSQKQALQILLNHKVGIITGGPGVGKTTLLKSLLQILTAKKMNVALCAPTGRAAKRLAEATHMNAKTIHRLLEYQPKQHDFLYHEKNPLPIDVLIIDEASMLDALLMQSVLKALAPHTALFLVGDVDQLPSVGSGNVLADIIAANCVITVRLTEIFRQALDSKIITNAYLVRQGQMPKRQEHDQDSDFFILHYDEPEMIFDHLIPVVCERLPKHYGFDPKNDIQVLTPMQRGALGAISLNSALQAKLNPHPAAKVMRYGISFGVGDKVMQTVNNYDKEIFNGDLGCIVEMDLEEHECLIQFDNKTVNYEFSELDELNLAYAISIHKSQGSEYPAVVIPISTQHYTLLARNLLYTGITRGKKLVVLMVQEKALYIAVKNDKSQSRLTKLAEWLKAIML